jgi:hypothetical protein
MDCCANKSDIIQAKWIVAPIKAILWIVSPVKALALGQ